MDDSLCDSCQAAGLTHCLTKRAREAGFCTVDNVFRNGTHMLIFRQEDRNKGLMLVIEPEQKVWACSCGTDKVGGSDNLADLNDFFTQRIQPN